MFCRILNTSLVTFSNIPRQLYWHIIKSLIMQPTSQYFTQPSHLTCFYETCKRMHQSLGNSSKGRSEWVLCNMKVLLKPEPSLSTIGKQYLLWLMLVYFYGIFPQRFLQFFFVIWEKVYWGCLDLLRLYIKASFSLVVHTLTFSNIFINLKCFRRSWKHLKTTEADFLEIKHVKLKWPLKVVNAYTWAKGYDSYLEFSGQNRRVFAANVPFSTLQAWY